MATSIQTRHLIFALAAAGAILGASPGSCGSSDPEDPPQECGAVCAIWCEWGNALDEDGCPTCSCNPPPSCFSDQDCGSGYACDVSVCLPCGGAEDGVACFAACSGQCVAVPACGANAPHACAGGEQCVCAASAGDRPGGAGFVAPPPDLCACVPIEPEPQACDPGLEDSCPSGQSCVCEYDDAEPARLIAPPASCTCQPHPCDER